MKRALLLVVASLLVAGTFAPTAGAATTSKPASIHRQKQWVRWALGSNTNPFLSEDLCGEKIGGVFFLVAAISPGVERDCTIRRGTPLLLSPAGTAFWAPTFGRTPAELFEFVDADFAGTANPSVTLDGAALSLDGALKTPDVYRSRVGQHSFIRTVDPSFPAARRVTRIASKAYFLMIPNLSTGPHTLVLSVDYFDTVLDATFHIRVTRGDD